MIIHKATLEKLNELVHLFDSYRMFYKQKSDINGAKAFLLQRLQKQDAVIFIAYIDREPVGFTQLYTVFSSVSMQRMYLLNDLYVTINYRGKGVGKALINKAKALAKKENKKGIAIQTAYDNPAQELYKRLGFVPDTDLHFFWTNK